MKITDQAALASAATSLTELPHGLRDQLAGFLGIMWSSIACAGTGAWLLFGETVFLQVLVAFGILMTGLTVHRASTAASWRDEPVRHGRSGDSSWRR